MAHILKTNSCGKGVSSVTALRRHVHERRGALAVAGGDSDARRPAPAAVDGPAVRLQDLQLHWVRFSTIYRTGQQCPLSETNVIS